MNGWYHSPANYAASTSSNVASPSPAPAQNAAAPPQSSNSNYSPDVVANPWNTSLLWSSGIISDHDPRSNFLPTSHWLNQSMPANVNTAPISYYYTSNTAGDTVNFYFYGHGLSVLDFRGPSRGRYNLTIDNTTSAIIDAYSQTDELANATGAELPPVIWTSNTMNEGTHSVVMSNLNNASMDYWGVVINPNNYKPGKSFVEEHGDVKTVVIASTVTAAVMVIVFALVAGLFYYFKMVRPRRRRQAAMDAEKKESLLPSTYDSSRNEDTGDMGERSLLRLNTAFLSSQGDLGRVPSRVTATTNESQYWMQPEGAFVPDDSYERQERTRGEAMFQEVRLESEENSALSSPIEYDGSPVSEVGPTTFSSEMGRPLSPLSPTNPAYATANTPTRQYPFWAPEERSPPTSTSMDLNNSRPAVNPFQDPTSPTSPMSPSGLTRSISRRGPLPTPPTALSALPPPTTTPPPRMELEDSGGGRNWRIEQDACSLHLSEEGMWDDRTGETLLPPPYAPRDYSH